MFVESLKICTKEEFIVLDTLAKQGPKRFNFLIADFGLEGAGFLHQNILKVLSALMEKDLIVYESLFGYYALTFSGSVLACNRRKEAGV